MCTKLCYCTKNACFQLANKPFVYQSVMSAEDLPSSFIIHGPDPIKAGGKTADGVSDGRRGEQSRGSLTPVSLTPGLLHPLIQSLVPKRRCVLQLCYVWLILLFVYVAVPLPLFIYVFTYFNILHRCIQMRTGDLLSFTENFSLCLLLGSQGKLPLLPWILSTWNLNN